MERLLKYSLRTFLFLMIFSRSKSSDRFGDMSPKGRETLSQTLLEFGEQNYNQGSPDNMTTIELALEVNPKNAGAWRELSVPYLKRGMPLEWKEYFDKAVEIDPVSWQGWRGYLKLFFYRDYHGAINDFNATDTLTPNVTDYPQSLSVHYLRGLAFLGLKDYKTAKEWMDKYVDEVKTSLGEDWVEVNAFLYRGILFEYLNKDEEAFSEYNKHLHYYKNSSDGYFHLAKLNYKNNNLDSAKAQVERAKLFFLRGYKMTVPYVETFEQIYLEDIEDLKTLIESKGRM